MYGMHGSVGNENVNYSIKYAIHFVSGMPRNFQRKTDIAKWTKEELKSALRCIQEGSSVSAAARRYGIPRTTLITRRKNQNFDEAKLGRCSILSEEQEVELTEHVILLSRLFYGITAVQLRRAAYEFVEKNNITHNFNPTNRMAGKDWLHGFLKVLPQHLTVLLRHLKILLQHLTVLLRHLKE